MKHFSGMCRMFLLAIYASGNVTVAAAEEQPSKTDLAFLLGEWRVERIYQPDTENERSATGTLACDHALQDQYIRCTYFFERPDQGPIHDDVYFNYNPIYGQYESLWLSATWPIKVTMRAPAPALEEGRMIWESSFLIEDEVTEWVRSTWVLNAVEGFSRRTDIRTSRDPEGEWLHWMDERVMRK